MGTITFLDLLFILAYALWPDTLPPGIIAFFFSLFTGSIFIWLTKIICVDSEAVRYTLFTMVNSSSAIATILALLGPWFFPVIFWGEMDICIDET